MKKGDNPHFVFVAQGFSPDIRGKASMANGEF